MASIRRLAGPLLRVLPLALLAAAPLGCGGSDGDGSFRELLFVSDRTTVRSMSLSDDGVPALRGVAGIAGIPGTYSRSGNVVTVTMQKHNVPTGYWVDLDFFPGAGGTATDGFYQATEIDDDTFTVIDAIAGEVKGGDVLRSPATSFGASYVQTGTTVTITLPDHGLDSNDTVVLDFVSGGALDDDVPIGTVLDDDTFTVPSDVSIDTSGLVNVTFGANYAIFGMAMHPNGRWLYVTSTYDCFYGQPYCWGGDLISRFRIDWGSGGLEFEASFRTSDEPDAVEDPAPVTLVFSEDGTRLFHQDDDLDGLRMWDVDPASGDVVLAAASGSNTTGQHGIAVLPDGSRVYHGTRVFTPGPSSLTLTTPGSSGEANQVLGGTMFAIMGGGNSPVLRALSLADPDAPATIATSAITPHRARDFAIAQGGSLLVTSGFGGFKTYAYDGATIVPAVGAGDTELRDGGAPFPADGDLSRVYRTISLNGDGDLLASAYFTNDPDAGTGGVPPSGFVLVRLSPDGSLAMLGDYPVARYARVARFFRRP